MNALFCPWESAQYLIFSSNVPTLMYYSHLVAIIAAVVFAGTLFVKARHLLALKLFVTIILFFVAWTVIDMLLWASNEPGIVLFYWGLQILLEMVIYAGAFYFAYVVITKHDLSFVGKVLLALLISPIVVLLPTSELLPAIDISYCNAVETSLVIYLSYSVEIFLSLLILVFSIREMVSNKERRKELGYFTLGIFIFLISFSSGNIIGSFTENWSLAQAGLFGMPVFIAFLVYSVVRFKTFNTKLLSTQAFVVTLWLLTLSALFVRTIENVRLITGINLLLATVLGYMVTRAVKREVAQREQIEELAGRLKGVNSILSHDVKAVLGKNKDMFNALLTGDLNTEEAKPFLVTSFDDTNKLISSIVTILESGHELILNPSSFDLKTATGEVITQLKKDAEAKGLTIRMEAGEGLMILADKIQLSTHVLTNLISNAINYTPKGDVVISIKRKDPATVLFSVHDTGVGITDEDKNNLFKEGGHGKDSRKVNVHSTGYGLYIAKKIVDAHGGHIWAESEGQGKGSTFFVELPVVLPPQIKKA